MTSRRGWRRRSQIAVHNHTGRGMVIERIENGRGQRGHGILTILLAFIAIIAILGPTVLVVSDAWAKGGSAGSGSAPGSSGNGGNSGGGNGGGNGNGNGNG